MPHAACDMLYFYNDNLKVVSGTLFCCAETLYVILLLRVMYTCYVLRVTCAVLLITYYVPFVTQIDFLSYVTKKDSSTTFSALTKFCLEIYVYL